MAASSALFIVCRMGSEVTLILVVCLVCLGLMTAAPSTGLPCFLDPSVYRKLSGSQALSLVSIVNRVGVSLSASAIMGVPVGKASRHCGVSVVSVCCCGAVGYDAYRRLSCGTYRASLSGLIFLVILSLGGTSYMVLRVAPRVLATRVMSRASNPSWFETR